LKITLKKYFKIYFTKVFVMQMSLIVPLADICSCFKIFVIVYLISSGFFASSPVNVS